MKCRECKYGTVRTMLRNGNSNSAHVGHFAEEACICSHPDYKGMILFYGKSAPRACPLKKKGENT